jgi:hypothetical protein
MVVPGSEVKNGKMGPTENLLYILIICPDISKNGQGSGREDGYGYNIYTSSWDTKEEGEIFVNVKWSTLSDTVQIGEEKFERSEGNTFVIIREKGGKLTTTQLANPNRNASGKNAIKFIKSQMPDNKFVSDVDVSGAF